MSGITPFGAGAGLCACPLKRVAISLRR